MTLSGSASPCLGGAEPVLFGAATSVISALATRLHRDLIDEAPEPIFTRLERLHDRVRSGVEVQRRESGRGGYTGRSSCFLPWSIQIDTVPPGRRDRSRHAGQNEIHNVAVESVGCQSGRSIARNIRFRTPAAPPAFLVSRA